MPGARKPGDSGIHVVGVVGAGTMGAGIAQIALEAGHDVVVHDVDDRAIERGRAKILAGLGRRAVRLELDSAATEVWIDARMAGLRGAKTLDAVGAEADIVIEAALEDPDLKRTIFRAISAVASQDAILATNTSALSVGSIATAATHPERVLGLHFFNPAPVMTLVEVVAGPLTGSAVVERATTLMASWGKTPVRSADSPGFIVNRVNRPYTLEALRMLERGVASVEAIDAAMRAAGFPLGPFELIDLAGVDINLAASRGIWEGLGRPDRLRPSVFLERFIEDGRLGRKTGSGFYRYEDGRRGAIEPDLAGGPGILGSAEIRAAILGAIEAEARLAVSEGVASKSDIDLALRLGAAHPSGPFERAAAEPTIEP